MQYKANYKKPKKVKTKGQINKGGRSNSQVFDDILEDTKPGIRHWLTRNRTEIEADDDLMKKAANRAGKEIKD